MENLLIASCSHLVFCAVRYQYRVAVSFPDAVMENRKKLTRIFPTDDRMVVVIDDRADVWPDCPNLLQVPAYSFFVGTGDINNPLANSNNGTTRALDAQAGVQTHTVATVVTTVDDRLASMGKVRGAGRNVCVCLFAVGVGAHPSDILRRLRCRLAGLAGCETNTSAHEAGRLFWTGVCLFWDSQ